MKGMELKGIIVAKGLTQKDVAKYIGVKGKNESTFDKALSISVIYYKLRIEMEVPRWAKLLPS